MQRLSPESTAQLTSLLKCFKPGLIYRDIKSKTQMGIQLKKLELDVRAGDAISKPRGTSRPHSRQAR